jgi:DNA polymerase III subunit delta
MKLQQRDLQRILSGKSTRLRAILVYGPDNGHVGETADAIAANAVEDLSDPFASVTLTGDQIRKDPAALMDAATALSLTGRARLVRVRGATEALTPRFQDLIDADVVEALVVVEADSLDTRSKLRKLFEASQKLGALACYGDDGPGLIAFVKKTLQERDVRIHPDALERLVANLGGDRRQTRSELDKLALMVGPGGEVNLDDVVHAIGDSGSLALDDIAFAAADGDGASLDRAMTRARADGENAVRILRSAISHFQRLHQAICLTESGTSPDQAIGGLRPPVFRNRRISFEAQLNAWSASRVEQCLDRLLEAEYRCKSTGMPDTAVCAQALIGVCLSRRPARRAQRGR